MSNKIKKILSLPFIGLFFLLISGVSFPASPAHCGQRVFILHSYERGHVCGQPQHDGAVASLEENGFAAGKNMTLSTYYMDTKRKNNTPQLIKEQARLAREKIREFDPDVLITLDDNAFAHVGLEFVDSGMPVIFCGLNGQPEDYNRQKKFMESRKHPGHNISGVYEKLHISDAARIHFKLFPDPGKMLFLVDKSPTGRAVKKQILMEIKNQGLVCDWEMQTMASWEDYKKTIRAANSSPDIGVIYPAALLLKDGQGNTHTAPEIFAWTVKHSKQPEIALNYSFTHMGLFGGAAVDFYAMGKQAGRMAAKVLEGEKAGDLPIEKARKYALAFNLDRAEQLGIDVPRDVILAADEVVRNND